jgi:hypothetical protein
MPKAKYRVLEGHQVAYQTTSGEYAVAEAGEILEDVAPEVVKALLKNQDKLIERVGAKGGK